MIDKITLKSINQETGYIDSKKAHQARLSEQAKPHRSFVSVIEGLMTSEELAEYKRREREKECFLKGA